MYWRRFIEDDMVNHNQELIFSTTKFSSEREVIGLNDDAFAYHIPKFFLRDPILKIVVRDYPRIFFSGRHNYEANLSVN